MEMKHTKDSITYVRFDDATMIKLRAISVRQDRSVASIVRKAVDQMLRRLGNGDEADG